MKSEMLPGYLRLGNILFLWDIGPCQKSFFANEGAALAVIFLFFSAFL